MIDELHQTLKLIEEERLEQLQILCDKDPASGRRIARTLIESGAAASFLVGEDPSVWIDEDTHENLLRTDETTPRWLASPVRVRLLYDEAIARTFGVLCAERVLPIIPTPEARQIAQASIDATLAVARNLDCQETRATRPGMSPGHLDIPHPGHEVQNGA